MRSSRIGAGTAGRHRRRAIPIPEFVVPRLASTEQLRKYERGHNRITVGKLYQLAVLFNVGIDDFYEGLPERLH